MMDVGYLRLLQRIASHWRLSLGVCLAVSLPIVVWALVFLPKSYEAVATIFIEDPKRGSTSMLRDWLPAGDASYQVAVLRSRSLAEAVVEGLPSDTLDDLVRGAIYTDYVLMGQNAVRRLFGRDPIAYTAEQRAVRELVAARVRFESLPSGEVEIRARAYHPRAAMELSNTYVDVLQARSRSYIRDEARASREFIENLLAQTKTNLQEAEESLAKMQRSGAFKLPERSALEMAQLAQLESSLADVQANKEIIKLRVAALKAGKLPAPLSAAAGPAGQRGGNDRLATLEAKLASLEERYTPEHPLVKATRAEITELKTTGGKPAIQLTAAPPDRAVLTRQVTEAEFELAALQQREDGLKQRIAGLANRLTALGAEEFESSKIQRRVETHRSLYATLSEKLSTARVQEQGEDRGLRVIDRATLPLGPNTSTAKKLVVLGIVLGIGMGVGVAGIIEYFNQPIETEDDILNATGLAVLGWVPTVGDQQPTATGEREPLSFVEGTIPDTLPVEGCRSVRTSLEWLSRGREFRTVMVASAGPKEGKSTLALNLGWVFWELGRRLTLIDADLRRPSLHRAFRAPLQPGLADLLAGHSDVAEVAKPIREGLVLVPAGSAPGAVKPGTLLTADKLRGVLETVKGQADLVLFDSAPVLAVPDNLILASLVDGVILVVRSGATQHRELLRAKELLEKAGAQLLGVVLNQVSPRRTRRHYGQYGEYYGLRPTTPEPWWRRLPWRKAA